LSSGEFELNNASPSPPQAARWYLGRNRQDLQRAGQENDVNRTPHAKGMDTAKRIAQQESRARLERCATNQASHRAQTKHVSRQNRRHHHHARVEVAEFNHAATFAHLTAIRTHAKREDRNAFHATRPIVNTYPNQPSPLRYAPHVDCENFHSGDDVVLSFLGCTYSFARTDFEQRVLRAAVELELAERPLNRAVRTDLVTAALAGEVSDPRSHVGEELIALCERDGEDPIYWLRKLVFRSAWLDHRIKHGLVDVQFDDAAGAFRIEPGRYPLPGAGHPSFAALTVPEDRA